MASIRKPCAAPGCRELVALGTRWCVAHTKKEEARRGTASSRGYDSKWSKARTTFLLSHPTCEGCGSKATVVDHRTPHKGDQGLFWDKSNWQALCASCHSRKTALHDGGFGR